MERKVRRGTGGGGEGGRKHTSVIIAKGILFFLSKDGSEASSLGEGKSTTQPKIFAATLDCSID
jgi:hypothetical protein